MAERRSTKDRVLCGLAWIAVWSLVGVLAGLASPAGSAAGGAVLPGSLVTWLLWAGLLPAALIVARWMPLDGERIAIRLAAHGGLAVALAGLHIGLSAVVIPLLVPSASGGPGPGPTLVMDLLAYAAVVAVSTAGELARRLRVGRAEARALEAKASRAQLEALKMQLHPHFLFNTLHAVGVLVRKKDTRGALRMLIGLSDLLRMTLDNAGKQVVPLRQELDFLERYLRVEQVRFGDRLEIDRQIGSDVLDAMVPSLALQPLLENAIRHGIAPRDAPGSISIRARREGSDRLRIEVADDGVGLAEDSAELSGMGLANVRARLDRLYGNRHHFEIADREDRPGVVAIIEIPLQYKEEAGTHE